MMSDHKHWHIESDENKFAWLGLDRNDTSVNTINNEVLDELDSIVSSIEKSREIKGLVIYSSKSKGFIAGADISYFSSFTKPEEAIDFLRKGQRVFDKIESLTIPTVAMIHGFCMGGGCELALACDYRIISDDDSSRIGLPEILLGIHPGWGGTVRLPRLIGGFKALSEVILTGRGLRAKKAKGLGLVDEAVPYRQLKNASLHYLNNKPVKHQPSWLDAMSNQKWARIILAKLMKSKVAKKVRKAHYPAPFAVVDNWLRDGVNSVRAQITEADSIARLVLDNDTCRNLIRAYFLRERMKGFAKESQFTATHVHVVGAGVMGGDIAAWCALRGLRVTLEDRELKAIAPAIKRADKLFKKRLRQTHLVQAAMDRLIPDCEGFGVAKADVVIEAIFENVDAKQALFKRIEEQAPSHAILATNTSSIPLDDISAVMQSPERLVGIHFFNPVAMMELVEVVRSDKTAANYEADACAFVGQIGRTPLPVKSSPGFLVNRVLMPYLMECVALLEEGIGGEVIDHAAESFGMMMGPVELADTVGLDVCLAVAENLTKHYGGVIPDGLRDIVKQGHLGRKSGKGFYQYKHGKPIKAKVNVSDASAEDIAHRLILRMVNEAAACLREGVVSDADLLDAGMIFGTGFAPFRGGPMQYADNFGKDQLNVLFEQLERRYGERFKVDDGLDESK